MAFGKCNQILTLRGHVFAFCILTMKTFLRGFERPAQGSFHGMSTLARKRGSSAIECASEQTRDPKNPLISSFLLLRLVPAGAGLDRPVHLNRRFIEGATPYGPWADHVAEGGDPSQGRVLTPNGPRPSGRITSGRITREGSLRARTRGEPRIARARPGQPSTPRRGAIDPRAYGSRRRRGAAPPRPTRRERRAARTAGVSRGPWSAVPSVAHSLDVAVAVASLHGHGHGAGGIEHGTELDQRVAEGYR
jgi:hypothetical protein